MEVVFERNEVSIFELFASADLYFSKLLRIFYKGLLVPLL